MENITKFIGARIRAFRKLKHLSQEQLAEKCKLHPTYIGQLERGEKNATLESIQKISFGLDITLEELFTNSSSLKQSSSSFIPDKIMLLIADLPLKDQKIIYELILQALKLR